MVDYQVRQFPTTHKTRLTYARMYQNVRDEKECISNDLSIYTDQALMYLAFLYPLLEQNASLIHTLVKTEYLTSHQRKKPPRQVMRGIDHALLQKQNNPCGLSNPPHFFDYSVVKSPASIIATPPENPHQPVLIMRTA